MGRRILGLLLIMTALALMPAAYASPPDPTWIAGLYDNADFADVVVFIVEYVGAVQPRIISWSRPLSAVGRVECGHTSSLTQSFFSSRFGRAPPTPGLHIHASFQESRGRSLSRTTTDSG